MTPDQVITVVAFITGAAVGLAGVAVSLYISSRDRDAARVLASDERRQQRLEATYQELITYLARKREQFNAVRPLMTIAGQPPPLPIPMDDMYRARAVTIAHASTEVWGLLDEFEEVCRSIVTADIALSGIEDTERQTRRPVPEEVYGMTSAGFHKRLLEDKERLGRIESRVHDQIRIELGAGQRAGSPESTADGYRSRRSLQTAEGAPTGSVPVDPRDGSAPSIGGVPPDLTDKAGHK